LVPWGYVFPAGPGNSAGNTRVQLRNMRLYALKWDGAWVQLLNTNDIVGQTNNADTYGNHPNDLRGESEGVSTKVINGRCFHFYTSSGGWISGPSVKGVFATVQARLILHDANGQDDRDWANFVVNIGVDNYRGNWTGIGDLGIGRFKRMTKEWRNINWTTLSDDDFRNNPPPGVTNSSGNEPVVVYQHTNFGGTTASFAVGDYNLAAMISRGASNDDVSSVRVASGYRVTFYEHDNFQGATLVRTGDDSTLVDEGWNDRASSMRVEKVWVAGSYQKMRGRWVKSDGVVRYLNNEYSVNDPVVTGIESGWHSAQWKFEDLGNGYYKIKNHWKGTYLHIEYGDHTYVKSENLGDSGWYSAQWSIEDQGGGYYRIRNRWQGTYLNYENGDPLRCFNIDPGAYSNMWTFENP
jgi:hypothetical protein